MRAAVFLDRDDTLMAANGLPAPPPPAAPGDVVDPALVRLLPGVLDGCRRLHAAGFVLVVVSNQGVVARGGATLDQVESVNARFRSLSVGAANEPLVTASYFCPFHPKGSVPRFAMEHPWRKPAPGMILAALSELDLDPARSWLIGDADRDIAAGAAAGLAPDRCLRVGPGLDFAGAAGTILRSVG